MNQWTAPTPASVQRSLGDRYEIERIVRAGGQGAVYRGVRRRAADGSPAAEAVALKLYFDPAQVARVEREVAVMEGLIHPCLCGLVEHGEIQLDGQGVRYVAWDYIEGQALDHRLQQAGPLSPRVVAVIGRDVAKAINEVWRYKIVHRDVNPKNIMLRTGERSAVLIDLGIAKHLSEDTLTAQGTTWGTPGYMSPEQTRGEAQLTCGSDIFSLGVTMLEALIGKHPAGNDQRTMATVPAPSVATVMPTAPAGLATLIDRMLQPRAAFRPPPSQVAQTCLHLLESLAA